MGRGRGGGTKKGAKDTTVSDDNHDEPELGRSAANEDDQHETDENEYEPIMFPSDRAWTPKNKVVLGETLPFVEASEKSPAGAMGKLLTAWAIMGICKFASEAVLKLDRDHQEVKRHLEVRCSIKTGIAVSLTNPKRNADAMWHQLFGDERIDSDACASCRKESGPFTSCVQVDGSCANCRYNGNAKRCDFHPANVSRSSADANERKRKSEEAENIEDLLRSIPSKHLKTLEKVIHLARELD